MANGLQYVDDPLTGSAGTPINSVLWNVSIDNGYVAYFNNRLRMALPATSGSTLLRNSLISVYQLRGVAEVSCKSFEIASGSGSPPTPQQYGGLLITDTTADYYIIQYVSETQVYTEQGIWSTLTAIAATQTEVPWGNREASLRLLRDESGTVSVYHGTTTANILTATHPNSMPNDLRVYVRTRQSQPGESIFDFSDYKKLQGEVIWPEDATYTDLDYTITDDWKTEAVYSKAYLPEKDRYFISANNGMLVRNKHRVTKYGRSYQVRFNSDNKFTLYGYQVELESEYDD